MPFGKILNVENNSLMFPTTTNMNFKVISELKLTMGMFTIINVLLY